VRPSTISRRAFRSPDDRGPRSVVSSLPAARESDLVDSARLIVEQLCFGLIISSKNDSNRPDMEKKGEKVGSETIAGQWIGIGRALRQEWNLALDISR